MVDDQNSLNGLTPSMETQVTSCCTWQLAVLAHGPTRAHQDKLLSQVLLSPNLAPLPFAYKTYPLIIVSRLETSHPKITQLGTRPPSEGLGRDRLIRRQGAQTILDLT